MSRDARSVARGGIPLSVKLILVTSVVLAAAVLASAYFSQRVIRGLAAHDAETRRADGMAAIQRESELLARNVATAVAVPLGASQLSDVPPILDDALRGYSRIQWLLVVDPAGQVVARTGGAPEVAPGARFSDALTARLDAAAPGAVERDGERTSWTYGTAIRLGDQTIGQVRVGVSTSELEDRLAASLAAAADRARAARRELLLVALALLAIGIALAALEGFRITRPIKQLAVQAEKIAGGDLEQRVPEDRRDEIGVLARNFNHMAGRLGHLLLENAQKVALEREMALARAVQQSMLPSSDLIVHGGVRITGWCAPASSCGGDWWTYRKLSGNRTLLVIGDATGHGLHSALIAATARGAVEALADADERLLTPEQVLRAIHAAIAGIGDHSLLMTCFAAVVDPAEATLHYANAGQNFPYIMRRSAEGVLDEAQIIAASGNPLGDPAIAQNLRRGSIAIHAGDVLVTFTDGVVERQNPASKLFGDRRLRGVFRGVRVDDERDLLALRERLVQAVELFAEGTVAQDDVTFVLVQPVPAQRATRPVRSAS